MNRDEDDPLSYAIGCVDAAEAIITAVLAILIAALLIGAGLVIWLTR